MIKQKYIDLINSEIDGANSSKESSELKKILAEDLGAQKLFDEVVKMSNVLDKMEEVEPPPNLRKNIMNAIPFEKYAVEEKDRSFKFPVPVLFLRHNVKYAYVFVSGLVLGIITFSVLIFSSKDSSNDISNLYGSMVKNTSPSVFQTADQLEFKAGEIYGTLKMNSGKDIVLAEVDLDTPREIEMVLEFQKNDMVFSIFKQLTGRKSDLKVDENSIHLFNAGRNQYLIAFDDKTPAVTPMNVKILSSGTLVYEGTVVTGPRK